MKKETAAVLRQERIAADIYSLELAVSFAHEVRAGQFVSLYTGDQSMLLPRPISICGADEERIRLVYRIAGRGTKRFSALEAGDEVEVLGPLGNGFPLDLCRGKRILLAGGGIGIPPMLITAKELKKRGAKDVVFAAGYRSEPYLLEEMEALYPVLVSTDDGSLGVHGTVLDAVREAESAPELIFACGPKPMLRALKEYALREEIPLYVSMEERMACGIGACLGCVCRTVSEDPHTHVNNTRICRDGPVFDAREVEL